MPFIYALLNKKKQIAYEALFRYVHENIIPLRCEYLMTDFETAIRNGFLAVVPNARFASCRFHYGQACKRRAAKYGQMVQLCRTNEIAKRIYQKLLSLPLLPAKDIKLAFDHLKMQAESCLSETDRSKFDKFFKYMENQWISGTKVCFDFQVFFQFN